MDSIICLTKGKYIKDVFIIYPSGKITVYRQEPISMIGFRKEKVGKSMIGILEECIDGVICFYSHNSKKCKHKKNKLVNKLTINKGSNLTTKGIVKVILDPYDKKYRRISKKEFNSLFI